MASLHDESTMSMGGDKSSMALEDKSNDKLAALVVSYRISCCICIDLT